MHVHNRTSTRLMNTGTAFHALEHLTSAAIRKIRHTVPL
jgi:hypothetical protein